MNPLQVESMQCRERGDKSKKDRGEEGQKRLARYRMEFTIGQLPRIYRIQNIYLTLAYSSPIVPSKTIMPKFREHSLQVNCRRTLIQPSRNVPKVLQRFLLYKHVIAT